MWPFSPLQANTRRSSKKVASCPRTSPRKSSKWRGSVDLRPGVVAGAGGGVPGTQSLGSAPSSGRQPLGRGTESSPQRGKSDTANLRQGPRKGGGGERTHCTVPSARGPVRYEPSHLVDEESEDKRGKMACPPFHEHGGSRPPVWCGRRRMSTTLKEDLPLMPQMPSQKVGEAFLLCLSLGRERVCPPWSIRKN